MSKLHELISHALDEARNPSYEGHASERVRNLLLDAHVWSAHTPGTSERENDRIQERLDELAEEYGRLNRQRQSTPDVAPVQTADTPPPEQPVDQRDTEPAPAA